jgi:hypothetical protein
MKMITRTKLKKVFVATAGVGALAFGLSVSSAHAATVSDNLFFGETNNLSDNDAETLNDFACEGCQPGIIDVGDTLSGIIGWGTVEDLTGGGGQNALLAPADNELSGVFTARVATKTFLDDGVDMTVGTADDVYGFTFAPDAAFELQYGAGAMVALFEDDGSGDPFTRLGPDQASDVADATDGTIGQVWTWGFNGDADEQWVAVGVQGPSLVPTSAQLAVYNFQLSSLFDTLFPDGLDQVATACSGPAFDFGNINNPCFTPGDSLIDIRGGGSVLGGAGSWPIFTNSDAVFRPAVAVPEPLTLALFGAGLLGLGWISRRRKAQA